MIPSESFLDISTYITEKIYIDELFNINYLKIHLK